MLRKSAVLALIVALSGSIAAPPAEAGSITALVKVITWVFGSSSRGADEAIDVFQVARPLSRGTDEMVPGFKVTPEPLPVPMHVPAGVIDELSGVTAVPTNKTVTFVY